jgi:hypothetical protein
MSDLLIVTGASSNHFNCLKSLLYSISLYEPQSRTIVYDLGLTEKEVAELVAAGHEVRFFRFEDYPPHVNINVAHGQYAWKPIIIADEFSRTSDMLLWLDAGNLVRAPLVGLRERLRASGLWSMTSVGTVAEWTHPGTLAYLNAPPAMLPKPNRNAALIGLRVGYPWVDELAREWKRCALDPACIAPPGSTRRNHRQDQAVLTVLLYQLQEKYGFELDHRRLDITVHHDRLTFEQARELLKTWKPWPRPPIVSGLNPQPTALA